MDKNRLWVIGAAFATVVIVALGWLLGVQPQFNAVTSATVQRVTVEQTNARYRAVLAKLKADHEQLPQLNAQLAALAASVPAETDSSPFVKELNELAAAHGVTIQALTFSDAQLYKPVVPPQAAATNSGAGSSGSTATPTPTPTPAPSPTAVAAPAAVTNPLVTTSNFFASPVQVTVRGSLAAALDFVQGAQKGSRLFLVTTLSSTPTTVDGLPPGTVDATVGGFIYSIMPAGTVKTDGSTPGTTQGATSDASAKK